MQIGLKPPYYSLASIRIEIQNPMTLRLWVLLFLSVAIAACGGADFMDKTKIDGSVLRGTAVKPSDVLFGRTVYIAKNFTWDPTKPTEFKNFGLCTGVILNERYIITAAHCTAYIEQSRVIFSEDINKPLQMSQVYKIKDYRYPKAYQEALASEKSKKIPPGPNNRSNRYDVAVLQLERPLENAKFIENYLFDMSTVEYLSHQNETINLDAYVAGYGRISEYNKIEDDPRFKNDTYLRNNPPPLTGTLMQAKMTFNAAELLQRTITRSQRFAVGVCGGDSGAPLFIVRGNKLYLQAIAIGAYKVKVEDEENKYNQCYGESTYLNLDYLKEWIFETIRILDKANPKSEQT